MAQLLPTGLYEIPSTANWHIVANNNFQKLNNLFNKIRVLWENTDAIPDGAFLIYDASIGGFKYIQHSEDQLTHGLGGRTEDITFSDPNKGIVLVDRADNSKKYRLYVENGTLMLEEVE